MSSAVTDVGASAESREGWRADAAALVAYTLIATAATWPLIWNVRSRLAGDATDPWQTYWGFWWWRHSLAFGDWPMHTHLMWWPEGLPLWFQTWDIPSAVAALPLWGWVPDFAIYNLLLFATFPLAGFTFYLFARELWGGRLAPFLAGCLYTFSTFHFGQALANLHIVSIEWSPLYFLGLVRTMRGRSYGGPVLAGAGLALATLASPYHLIFCAVGTALLFAFEWGNSEGRVMSPGFVGRALVLALVFAVFAGWLLAGMTRTFLSEPYTGSHDPVTYSSDLQSFFVPNAASVWAHVFTAWRAWTGGPWSSAGYFGYVTLILAVVGAWRAPAARAYLFIAGIGAYLSLGPLLHVGGAVYSSMIMLYAWLQRFVPILKFGGIPSRFSWLSAFGLATAAGAALSSLTSRGRRGRAAAVAVTMLALVESWPHAMTMTVWPAPAIMREWAADPSEWAVLDATYWPRALWHQTLHHHPMLAGYATRVPERMWDDITTDPVISALYPPQIGPVVPAGLPVSAETARQRLADLKIRFVIEDDAHAALAEGLQLPLRYRGDGLVIYEMPQ